MAKHLIKRTIAINIKLEPTNGLANFFGVIEERKRILLLHKTPNKTCLESIVSRQKGVRQRPIVERVIHKR